MIHDALLTTRRSLRASFGDYSQQEELPHEKSSLAQKP
jgi:hypothetical protein